MKKLLIAGAGLVGVAALYYVGRKFLARLQLHDQEGTQVGIADRLFIEKAARAGVAEVELGHLAQQQGATDAVKRFGERMVKDHGGVNDELITLALNQGISPPRGPSAEQRALLQRLQGLSGSAFDQQYVAGMIDSHKQVISLFQHEAEHGTDEALRGLAQRTLPTLQEHLRMAEALQVHPPAAEPAPLRN